MSDRIPLWIDLRQVPVNKRLPYLRSAAAASCEAMLLGRDDPHLGREDLHTLLVDGRNQLKDGTQNVGRIAVVRDARSQERAARAQGIVVVDTPDWAIIPLENLVAERRDRPGTLYALARTPEEALRFRHVLEAGVHGVVLMPGQASDIEETDRLLRHAGPPTPAADPPTATAEPRTDAPAAGDAPDGRSKAPGGLAATQSGPDAATPQPPQSGEFLESATVTRVADASVGDRVCVDATSLFRDGEGLLVGSTARSFVLVHAETIESEYVRARPFRVNAGAVHAYLYAPGGRTRYLSELGAGDHVLAVHPDGVHRVMTVGRAKIERRPHTLIAWRTRDGHEGSMVLQTAETIRLVRPDGTPVSVTALKQGDAVLVHREDAARHFGMPVDEHLEER